MLTLDRVGITEEEESTYKIFNIIFYGIFVLELIIKLFGLGVKNYFRSNYNKFDFALIIASTVDIVILSTPSIKIYNSSAIQALKGFRLIRMFKLAREWV